MSEEMMALEKNDTWKLVDLPRGRVPVGCRWVYTIKYRSDGAIERQIPEASGKANISISNSPDITYAMVVVSQFMHAPKSGHLEVVYRILKYLKFSPGKGLLYAQNNHLRIEGYSDADWAKSISDGRSTSCYCTFVGGNLVTWRSKK
ncbi:uncharacterized mitochondrial protein AtMg00810-like [Macadamia integrifolia]|uniref:uncharacterized mitochondrial protein AtMg00810-like n=1 Tax=Macadamia integrifolia TaxID=60698 RepID=UPI001C4F2E66|nr:uncharacterized mitochondrial protein AtMg00810-like [Macadamia integrifolia]